ncbi:hypothetical protein Tco_1469625 [Tanacetum coccineum]
MYGSNVTSHVRHSRLMNEFDKFAAKEEESLESMYKRLTTLVNIMDRKNVLPILVSINTKFLNCLQPERSKYVTMVLHNQTGDIVSYDELYDSLVQFEPHVLASKEKKAAKNHDPLALLAHSNASLSQSHKFSTPTNNRLRTSSNTRNQVVIQDGRVDIQTKNAGYGGNDNRNAGRQNMNQAFNAGNGNDESNQIVYRVSRTESNPGKANVQCYNSMKDQAESNLKDKGNDFMLYNSYGDETLEELTATVIMMAQIQPADDNANSEPSYDAKAVSEVNASNKVHAQVNHVKDKTIIHTSNDDQIDSNIIFDDPYVENNGGTSEHDSTAHDQYHDIKMMAYNVQREAENQKRLNNEL